jgi:mono/diheme cytochrome c family protein
MKQFLPLVSVVLIAAVPRDSLAVDQAFATTVEPVLKAHCVGCHGGDKPKGDFDLGALAPDFAKNAQAWKGVMDRLADGSMPPKSKPRPTAAEQAAVTTWVARELTAFQASKTAADGRARLRRLNRVEYVNSLRDLLGATIDIETLPEDGVAGGFDNVDAGLELSSTLLERYLESAETALDTVFVKGSKPAATKIHVDMAPLAKQLTKTIRPQPRFGVQTLIRDNEVIFQCEDQPEKIIDEARASASGLHRFRISANAYRNGPGMTFLVYAGNYRRGGALITRLVGAFDVPDKPTVVEFTEAMAPGESIRIAPFGLPRLYKSTPDDYSGPGMAVQWIEIEGPLVSVWPPASATRLLGDVDVAKGTLADAEAILRRFTPRAFRRPVAAAELAEYVNVVKARLDKGNNFEAALRVGLKVVLCSPDFLYLSATPGKLNDFDLAARLSYFLWSSTPDDALAELAAKGELGKPDVLKAQVERMLEGPKAHAFTENFTGQWLSLRNLKATSPDRKLYPDFDELLEWSMPRETHLFFEEILKGDRNVLEFVHSDWTMLNERLALLYKVPNITGSALRKVQLPAKSHRGGALTQAAVLKVTANGTNTSPVVRGAWVLDHILGTPAPPPPKDVPAIEPDVRGATTIREQLVKHRAIESCAACHAKIDPVGNALENFDVIGGWRENYRAVSGSGRKQIRIDQPAFRRQQGVGMGPSVQAADEMPGGRKFDDVDGFKKIILENPDQFARGLTEKLLVYSTGHKLEFADAATADQIVADIRSKGFGLRSLIHAIVQSPTFRSK